MACEHGVSREARCYHCEDIAAAENRVRDREAGGIHAFARASDDAKDRKKVRALAIVKELKDYAQDAPRDMMPLVVELEGLL